MPRPHEEQELEIPTSPCDKACKDFTCCLKNALCTKQCTKILAYCGLCDKFLTCDVSKKMAVQGTNTNPITIDKLIDMYKKERVIADRLKTELTKVPSWNIMGKQAIKKRGQMAIRKAGVLKDILNALGIRVEDMK